MTASSCDVYLNRRHDDVDVASRGIDRNLSILDETRSSAQCLGSAPVVPQLVEREKRITDCSDAPVPEKPL